MQNNYVLMLENDKDDRYFTEETIRELSLPVTLRFEDYHPDLLDTLPAKPVLVLLGCHSYPEYGIGIVREFKTHPDWSHIPVVVLTEQMLPSQVHSYYRAGANSVIRKPFSMEVTRNKISNFFYYWLQVAEIDEIKTRHSLPDQHSSHYT